MSTSTSTSAITDMTPYAGASFVKTDDVKAGPIRGVIRETSIGRYDRPVLTLDSGDQLTLNATNVRVLCRSYGADSRRWAGHTVELHLGQVQYNGTAQPSVLVRPISPPRPEDMVEAATPPRREVIDDEIPF